jgi:hypothetical protein
MVLESTLAYIPFVIGGHYESMALVHKRPVATDLVVARFHVARTSIEWTRHFEYSRLCMFYP